MKTLKVLTAAALVPLTFAALAGQAKTPKPKMPVPTQAPAAAAEITPMTPDVVASYDATYPDADFTKKVVMIPMRDGVKLYTVIVMKKGTQDGPILLSRTPYDAKSSTQRTHYNQNAEEIMPAMDSSFLDDGYIRVYQDIRGEHNSEGDFVMTRPIIGPLNDTKVDESTDAYDLSLIHI